MAVEICSSDRSVNFGQGHTKKKPSYERGLTALGKKRLSFPSSINFRKSRQGLESGLEAQKSEPSFWYKRKPHAKDVLTPSCLPLGTVWSWTSNEKKLTMSDILLFALKNYGLKAYDDTL